MVGAGIGVLPCCTCERRTFCVCVYINRRKSASLEEKVSGAELSVQGVVLTTVGRSRRSRVLW